MNENTQRSALALAVLALLSEAAIHGDEGMHPYRMQQLIRERGMDTVVNVGHRASLYRTIERLEKGGLVVVQDRAKEEGRPERTLYAITSSGSRLWRRWMIEALSVPGREFPVFPAAIAFLPLLTPEEAERELDKRRVALEAALKHIDVEVAKVPTLPRLFLLETEYVRAATAFELEWVRSVLADLRSGAITWSTKWLRSIASQFGCP